MIYTSNVFLNGYYVESASEVKWIHAPYSWRALRHGAVNLRFVGKSHNGCEQSLKCRPWFVHAISREGTWYSRLFTNKYDAFECYIINKLYADNYVYTSVFKNGKRKRPYNKKKANGSTRVRRGVGEGEGGRKPQKIKRKKNKLYECAAWITCIYAVPTQYVRSLPFLIHEGPG